MAGIKVYNDTGFTQINSEHRNLRMSGKGTVATASWILSRRAKLYTSAPLVAFRCTDLCAMVSDVDGGGPYVAFLTPAASVDWWTFDVGTSAVFNSGLRIWNAAGEQVYDAADRVPKLVGAQFSGVVLPPENPIINNWLSYAYSSYVTSATWLAVAQSYGGSATLQRSLDGYYYQLLAAARTTGSSGADLGQVAVQASTGLAPFVSPAAQFLFLDVNNL